MQPFDPGPTPHPADVPDQDPRPRIAAPAVLRRADDLRDLAAMWEALREAAAAQVTFCPRVELFSDGSGRLVGEVDAVCAEWERLSAAAPAIRAAIAEGGGR